MDNIDKIFLEAPQCPLCLQRMQRVYIPSRGFHAFVCHRDQIAIRVSDPLVGKWHLKKEKIACPNCQDDMRYFFTSTGYKKAVCVRKGCQMALVEHEPDEVAKRQKAMDANDVKNAKGKAVKRSAKLDAEKLEEKLGVSSTKELDDIVKKSIKGGNA